MDRFETVAFPWILHAEGGGVNHPDDPGLATKFGVSLMAVRLRDVDKDGRLDFDLDGDGDVDEQDIWRITPADARRLFLEDYWSLSGAAMPGFSCGSLPPGVDVLLFDAAILHGPRRAVSLLQLAIGMPKAQRDGVLGGETVAHVKRAICAGADVELAFLARRAKYLAERPHAPAFIRGWLSRLIELGRYLETMRREPATAIMIANRWERMAERRFA